MRIIKMSDLPIKELKIEQAFKLNPRDYHISLKVDGTLIYYKNNNLISPRGINRNDRFKHILNILQKNNFPECYGEMFIENGCIFDITSKANWSKAKFMPIDILYDLSSYSQRQKLIDEQIDKINSPFIVKQRRFTSIYEGWLYVQEHESEGLVIRNDKEFYKSKLLKEAKIPIKSHEQGKDKGTFILIDDNRISGTSESFIIQYLKIKQKGKTPIAEIEYQFLTKDNKYFQPRLRRIFENEQ